MLFFDVWEDIYSLVVTPFASSNEPYLRCTEWVSRLLLLVAKKLSEELSRQEEVHCFFRARNNMTNKRRISAVYILMGACVIHAVFKKTQ